MAERQGVRAHALRAGILSRECRTQLTDPDSEPSSDSSVYTVRPVGGGDHENILPLLLLLDSV